MGRARFAEIGKRVPGGGKCNFSAKKEGKSHRPPPCRVGVITSSISGKPGTWDRLSGTVSCKRQALRLSQKSVAAGLWPLAIQNPGGQARTPPPPRCSAPKLLLGEALRCFGASLLSGPGAVESSRHTSQQAGSGHWAPPGPGQARFSP